MAFVAITGSIGCGKTTISNILRDMGFLVYDVDAWCRELYFKNDFLKTIRSVFPEVFEGDVFNKRALRNIVFNDVNKLKILENLTHPYLTKRLLDNVSDYNGSDIVFTDVALLYEMGWDQYFDKVVLADIDYETQKSRVMKRDGISGEDFDKINNIQMKRDEKIKKVDFVINTGCNEEELIRKIKELIKDIKNASN
jgi:dephospho-CoA kinase